MTNTAVRAAAEVLPDDPRYPQRFSFLRQKPVSSPARRAEQPAATHEDKFMNQHVNRRALISASAAISAAALTSETMDEALADQHWEIEAVAAQKDDLPSVGWELDAASIQTLHALMKAHREAFLTFEDVCYLSDSVALGREPTRRETRIWNSADKAEEAALLALCRHRCATSYEHETKARYLSVHTEGGQLQDHHVEALLASSLPMSSVNSLRPSNKGIAWVRRMRADGYVFVSRGHVRDVGNYSIRKDRLEGDDTARLLEVLERRSRAKIRAA